MKTIYCRIERLELKLNRVAFKEDEIEITARSLGITRKVYGEMMDQVKSLSPEELEKLANMPLNSRSI